MFSILMQYFEVSALVPAIQFPEVMGRGEGNLRPVACSNIHIRRIVALYETTVSFGTSRLLKTAGCISRHENSHEYLAGE